MVASSRPIRLAGCRLSRRGRRLFVVGMERRWTAALLRVGRGWPLRGGEILPGIQGFSNDPSCPLISLLYKFEVRLTMRRVTSGVGGDGGRLELGFDGGVPGRSMAARGRIYGLRCLVLYRRSRVSYREGSELRICNMVVEICKSEGVVKGCSGARTLMDRSRG